MKKLFKKLALMVVALLTFSVGSNYTVKEVKAAAAEYVASFDLDSNCTGYSKTWTLSLGEYGWTVYGGQNNKAQWNYFRMGGKEASTSSLKKSYAYLNDPIQFEVKSIDLSFAANDASVTGYELSVYSDKEQKSLIDSITLNKGTSITVNPTTALCWPANSFYRLDIYKSYTSKNKGADLSSISFFKASSAETIVKIVGESNAQVGVQSTYTVSTNATGEVVWSSSDETVATITNGVLTPNKMGSTTITAEINGVSDSKEIKVYPKENTELTILEAINVCGFTGTTNTPYKYYASGKISSIDYAYSTSSNNISVTITDGTNSIKAYKMSGGENLAVDLSIKVYGELLNYNNSTPEFVEGCTFELIVDDTISKIVESLNKIESYMSLSYQYKEVTENKYIVTDTLNQATTEVTGSTYTSWEGKSSSSNAVYAGSSAGSNESIQLRSKTDSSGNYSGVFSTTSGGNLRKITITWNDQTAAGRTLNIYGSNYAYETANDLYSSETQGTLLGTIVKGTSTELNITDDYAYVGLRSNADAMYLSEVKIEWEVSTAEENSELKEYKALSDSNFMIRCGVDNSIENIEGIDTYGVKVSAGNNTVYYSDSLTSTIENGVSFTYVVINLGDIINDVTKLTTKFTVAAYVEVEDVKYISESVKEYSVADMVKEYYTNGPEETKAKVEHLYNYLVEQGLIA